MRTFDQSTFVVGLAFVGGFIDVFGFMHLGGVLPAHVTGNLIFLAIYLSQGHYDRVLMSVGALPIFGLGVAASAWMIGFLSERGRGALLPALLLEALLLLGGMTSLQTLPRAADPNTVAGIATTAFAVLAMALQNTVMRLLLKNLPPTTVMTGNYTQLISDTLSYLANFPSIRHDRAEKLLLERQAIRIVLTMVGFFVGALTAGFLSPGLRGLPLLLPILVLLCLIPIGRGSPRW